MSHISSIPLLGCFPGRKKVLIASINTTGIIYGHTSLPQPHASTLLSFATQTLLKSLPPSSETPPSVLWTLLYTRFHHVPTSETSPPHRQTNEEPNATPLTSANDPTANNGSSTPTTSDPQIINLPPPPPGLAIDDSVLKTVREAWAKINGGDDDDGTFLRFEERADLGEADEDDDDDVVEESSNTTGVERQERDGRDGNS